MTRHLMGVPMHGRYLPVIGGQDERSVAGFDWASERGAATAEYAIAMMAAVGFAGVLVVILRGDEVRGMLTDLVRNALQSAG